MIYALGMKTLVVCVHAVVFFKCSQKVRSVSVSVRVYVYFYALL